MKEYHTYKKKHRTIRHKRQKIQKSKKKKKQHGKGKIEQIVDSITKTIQHNFPDYEYALDPSPTNSTIGIGIYCPDDDPSSDIPSITFTIDDNELFISTLTRCIDRKGSSLKSMRGTDVLKKIIAIGEELKPLGVEQIRLTDASLIYYLTLPCSISLAGYMILTSDAHHSWYNSHGFKSPTYDEEVKHNTAFSQQPMMDLLYMIHAYRSHKKRNPLGNLFGNSRKGNWRASSVYEADLVQELMDTYKGQVRPDMSIQEGIERIHHLAQQATSCKSPAITFCQDAINAALKYGIMYDTRLVRFL